MYYLNTFLLYSILGHLLETIFFSVLKLHKRSGFMFLWWTPLYGIGAVLSLFVYRIVVSKMNNKFWRNVLLFVLYFGMFTLLESFGGFLIEKIFGYEMWNYSNIWGHIGKFASIPTSAGWALMSLFYVYVLKKMGDFIISKIPRILSIILSIIFFIDCICSIMKVFY